MNLSQQAQKIIDNELAGTPKMGDLKACAKAIKQDHELASELWSTGDLYPRLLATLIFDKKQLNQTEIESLVSDLGHHSLTTRNQISEWLLANQLMKSKPLTALITTWQEHPNDTLRRLFWYHQARLRWTGQTPPDNSGQLLDVLESQMADEVPEVQWAMNFCAGQIGIFEPRYRDRCINLGQTTGLYKDEVVARNCTPSYLPEFIRIEVGKRS